MTNVSDGGPAFPQSDLSGYGMGPAETGNGGMSLRDWVMGQCIAADFGSLGEPLQIAIGETREDALRRYWAGVAEAAAIAADAMIAARGAK